MRRIGKTTLLTHRHIIKGSSRFLPFVSLNQHLCMQVTRRVMPAAVTEISRDGQALVVHRFDVDEKGARRLPAPCAISHLYSGVRAIRRVME